MEEGVMRNRLFVFALVVFLAGVILFLIFSDGAEEKEVQGPEANDSPLQELEEDMLEDEPLVIADEPAEETILAPIGNRVTTDYQEPEAEVVAFEGEIILITAQKTMTVQALSVSVGEMVTWRNEDSSPHILKVEQGNTLIEQGPRLNFGDEYTYTFTEKGEFLVRDIFSGNARVIVTVS